MKTSTIRRYYRLAGYTYLGAFGFAGVATFMYLHTHWQAYRVRMITAAAARGILEPVGTLLKELKKSGMDVQLPDFEIESENKGVRRKSTFRLIDGQVKPVEEIEEEIEEKSWWQEWKSGEDSGGQLRDWESAGGYYGVMSTT